MKGWNIDIFKPEWLNVVFAGRNQAYGAYDLRKHNTRNTNMALLIAIGGFVLAIAVPTMVSKMRVPVPETVLKKTVVDLDKIYTVEPPIEHQKTEQTKKTAKPKTDMIADLPPVVKADAHNDPPTDKQLLKADPGPVTMKGSDDGPILIDETPAKQTTAGNTTEATHKEDDLFIDSEFSPEYPGGEAAFGKFLQKNIRYPEVARENDIQGKVYLQFVVERDGSLTDIQILREPGGGTGEEAARVLKMSPHWKPGIQNGHPVRVRYAVPVNFSLGGQN